MIFLPFLLFVGLLAQVPLEPPAERYDRLNGDTPSKVNERLAYKPLPFFQADCNITDILQADAIDQFVQQVAETKTDAFLYLTVYPHDGFAAVSEKAFNDFVSKIAELVKSGNKVLIRYASEMNGSWFKYGQQPATFKREWIRLVNATRQACAANLDRLAFMWSPNNGNGYPFEGYGIVTINPVDVPEMDTNRDGVVGPGDDPYTPYYPGDDYVDWVGMSIYHYSNVFPYKSNDIPPPDKFETQLTGRVPRNGTNLSFNVYDMFSGSGIGGQPVSLSKGGKPFFVAETAATIFPAVRDPNTNVWTAPPEFRDFNTLGWATNQTVPSLGGISQQNDTLTVETLRIDLAAEYGQSLVWANPQPDRVGSIPTVQGSSPTASKNGDLRCKIGLCMLASAIFLA